MTHYSSLPLLFIASGLVLLTALAYLARLFRRHRRAIGALLKLAQTNLDPLQLPAAAWPALTGGGIKRMELSGHWFGHPVHSVFGAALGKCAPNTFSFYVIADGDVHLDFCCYTQASRGESRLLAEHLAGVFHLLLETAVHSKMESLSAALAEQVRLILYLQHDLRNLAQWVEWLADDFTDARDDQDLLKIARRLRNSAPHAATRARRILEDICKPPKPLPPVQHPLCLNEVIRQAAEHAGIAIVMPDDQPEQEVSVWLHRELLDRALDNLFSHAAPLMRSQPDMHLSVRVTRRPERVAVNIEMPHLDETRRLPPERLFEPFAGGLPGGLGLGLYQARKSLAEAGGKLLAEVREHHICFRLDLPGV